MKKICLNRKYYDIPESWDELSPKQLLTAMDILFLKGYNAEQMLLRLVQCITGINDYRFLKSDITEMEEYFYLTSFFFDPDITFTRQHIPSYKLSHTEFFGPSDALDNLRMKEFTLTEDLFTRWFDSEQKDMDLLDQLISILYRPAAKKYNVKKDPAGDRREPFNQNIAAFYASSYVKDWPTRVKLAIATWYNGCRVAIVKNNPDVFGGAGDDPSRYGLVSVMLNVAESHVFGTFKDVEEQYVHMVMMHLNETIDKANRLKKEMKL